MILAEFDGAAVRLSVRRTVGRRRIRIVRSAVTLDDDRWALLDADEQPLTTDADATAALRFVATGER